MKNKEDYNMIDLNTDQKAFVEKAYSFFKKDVLTRAEINSFYKKNNLKNPSWLKTEKYKVDRGQYKLPVNSTPMLKQKNY